MDAYEREIQEEIETARVELSTFIPTKQKEVVQRMGTALEKIRQGERRSGICEELKALLAEEIKRKLISEKIIEIYSKAEWKNPIKSASGKKGAESRNRVRSAEIVSAEPQPILVGADGNSTDDDEFDDEPEPVKQAADVAQLSNIKAPQPDRVEFSFSISYDELHAELQRQFAKHGIGAKIWIVGAVDSTGRLLWREVVAGDE
jgi:hypothetical protein